MRWRGPRWKLTGRQVSSPFAGTTEIDFGPQATLDENGAAHWEMDVTRQLEGGLV